MSSRFPIGVPTRYRPGARVLSALSAALCAVIAASLSLPMPFVPARKLTSRRILPRIKAETTLSSRQQSMPLYEYQCKKCHHRFEKIQKFSDPHVKKCPDCGGPVEQVISAPAVQVKRPGGDVPHLPPEAFGAFAG